MLRPTLFALTLFTAAASALAGETIRVPEDHDTIQAAVDAAGPGDTVLVSAGTYAESVTVAGKRGVSIVGEGDAVVDADGALVGIDVSDGSGVRITGITVRNMTQTGIRIADSTSVRVTGCTIQGPGSELDRMDGIQVDRGVRVRIEDNDVSDVNGVGILLYHLEADANDPSGGGERSIVRGNRISRVGNCGVIVNGERNRVDSNAIDESASDGVDVYTEAVRTLVLRNAVTRGRQGYRDEGTDSRFKDNTVEDSSDDGWEVEGRRGKFLRCSATNVTGSGWNVEDASAGNKFAGCSAVNSGESVYDHGFEVRGSDNLLADCTSSGSSGDGFHILGTRNSLVRCAVDGAARDGVAAVGGGNRFTSCTAEGSGRDGWRSGDEEAADPTLGAGNTFAKCTAASSAQDGFHLESNENLLISCTATGSGRFGRFTSPAASDNEIRGGSFVSTGP